MHTFGTYYSLRVQLAKTVVHFAHFQVQAQMAARHTVTVPTVTAHARCQVSIYSHLSLRPQDRNPVTQCASDRCICRDLDLEVTLHCRWLSCCLGPTACRVWYAFRVNQNTTCQCSEFSHGLSTITCLTLPHLCHSSHAATVMPTHLCQRAQAAAQCLHCHNE